jgi:hypothetical protein
VGWGQGVKEQIGRAGQCLEARMADRGGWTVGEEALVPCLGFRCLLGGRGCEKSLSLQARGLGRAWLSSNLLCDPDGMAAVSGSQFPLFELRASLKSSWKPHISGSDLG